MKIGYGTRSINQAIMHFECSQWLCHCCWSCWCCFGFSYIFFFTSSLISFTSPTCNFCLAQWVHILWMHELTIKFSPHIQIDQFSSILLCKQQQWQQPRRMWLWKLNQCAFDYTHYHYVICIMYYIPHWHTDTESTSMIKIQRCVHTTVTYTNNVTMENMFPVSIT